MSAPEQIWAWCFQDIEGAWADWGGYARPTNMHPLDKREQITGAQYTRTDLIHAMIREAVEAEREACALVAEHQHKAWAAFAGAYALVDDDKSACAYIAAAIRARKWGEA